MTTLPGISLFLCFPAPDAWPEAVCVVDSRGHAQAFLLSFAPFLLVDFATKFSFLRPHKRQMMTSQVPIDLSFSSLDSKRGLLGGSNNFICNYTKGISDTLLPPEP